MITGVIAAVSKSGTGLKVGDNWYNSFKAHGCNTGQSVEFDVKPGTTFILGKVKVVEAPKSEARNQASATDQKWSSNAAKKCSCGKFPIGPFDGDRKAVRQGALSNAVAVFLHGKKQGTPIDYAEAEAEIIGMAYKFEAFIAGDIERHALEEGSNDETKDDDVPH